MADGRSPRSDLKKEILTKGDQKPSPNEHRWQFAVGRWSFAEGRLCQLNSDLGRPTVIAHLPSMNFSDYFL
jgi:hypothetical protein